MRRDLRIWHNNNHWLTAGIHYVTCEEGNTQKYHPSRMASHAFTKKHPPVFWFTSSRPHDVMDKCLALPGGCGSKQRGLVWLASRWPPRKEEGPYPSLPVVINRPSGSLAYNVSFLAAGDDSWSNRGVWENSLAQMDGYTYKMTTAKDRSGGVNKSIWSPQFGDVTVSCLWKLLSGLLLLFFFAK